MNVLVTGASGFIASEIVTELEAAGHSVTCCVRNVCYTKTIFPNARVIACNFVKDTHADIWVERLQNIDVVINCVGIFYHPQSKIIWAIHYDTPKALFDACVRANVKKVIQISALGVDKANVDYAKSKKAADDYLLTLPIPAYILRPSLVYGRGSYGGTSLFRGLVGLPWFIPVPGDGQQTFQPIYCPDLAKAVVNLVNKDAPQKSMVLPAVSRDRITMRDILLRLRAWLGFAKAGILPIPLFVIRLGTLIGNLFPNSAMNTTAYKMLLQNNIADATESESFYQEIGFVPRNFTAGVSAFPSTVQDHWHARLYFLKPLLLYSVAFVWIWTAICSLFLYPKMFSYALLNQIGVNTFWQPILLYGGGILDGLLGIAMLIGYQLKKVYCLQILLILIYTAIITCKLSYLWLDPFTPIVKNIPLIVSILILMALESDR